MGGRGISLPVHVPQPTFSIGSGAGLVADPARRRYLAGQATLAEVDPGAVAVHRSAVWRGHCGCRDEPGGGLDLVGRTEVEAGRAGMEHGIGWSLAGVPVLGHSA